MRRGRSISLSSERARPGHSNVRTTSSVPSPWHPLRHLNKWGSGTGRGGADKMSTVLGRRISASSPNSPLPNPHGIPPSRPAGAAPCRPGPLTRRRPTLRVGIAVSRTAIPPLPEGEGRGEGKALKRTTRTLKLPASRLPNPKEIPPASPASLCRPGPQTRRRPRWHSGIVVNRTTIPPAPRESP